MASSDVAQKALAFLDLHRSSETFVMPCAWDAFSAMLMQRAGFKCIGTTSGGVNWVQGREDYIYTTPMWDMLRAYGDIASATSLPVSADLENGYGADAEGVTVTITEAIANGIVGGSIEDQQIVPTNDSFSNGELYPLDVAVERIVAARAAADLVDYPFTLTARCEIYYTSSKNKFTEAVDRSNAYREAGADCLFVPGLNNLTELERLVKEVDGPISFGMGATETPLTVAMLANIGVRRVSTGGGLTRATFNLLQDALTEISQTGSFGYLDDAMSEAQINKVIGDQSKLSRKTKS